MDLILRNARIVAEGMPPLADIGIEGGRIAAIEPALAGEGPETDVGGRLVSPGFVESHIHLDKSRILERCDTGDGAIRRAIEQVAGLKKDFTVEDIHARAKETLERCILEGTTHMRTHLEVDPTIGHRGLDGVLPLIDEYAWAIDLEVCVFPQEGLTNNPGTEELMIGALGRGARVVGAAPYTDSDPKAQIDRIFEIARDHDVDIDMHLDFGADPDDMDVEYVCRKADAFGWGGRVAVGHVTKLSVAPPARFEAVARMMADAGVALTVLPATDLYLMGRGQEHSVIRGVAPAHRLTRLGVNCSLSTNNVLNPFTPFGDCSLLRMANLYAHTCQVNGPAEMRDCFGMITARPARLMRIDGYGVAAGRAADLVVLDCETPEAAVAEMATPLYGFKRGRRTFARKRPVLDRPG